MKKIDALYTVGEYSHYTAAGFGAATHMATNQQSLILDLEKELETVVTLLVKGSRSAQMENVVHGLMDKKES
jgi:UDP-N-acetylmuramoyl-tripeptide--D-alanyl-D-alanine ligase